MDDIDNRYLSLIKHFKREKGQFQIIKELGKGNFGVAFELNNGNVVKFTTDKQEIKTCKKLVGHINKYLCNIYEIRKTPLIINNYEYFLDNRRKTF